MSDSRLLFGGAVVVRGLMSDEEWAFFAPFVIEGGDELIDAMHRLTDKLRGSLPF